MPATYLWTVRTALTAMFGQVLPDVFNGGLPPKGNMPRIFVLVAADGGVDATEDTTENTARSTFTPAPLSLPHARDEDGIVTCALWQWTGDPSQMDTLRQQAATTFAALTAVVMADRSLSGTFAASDAGAYMSAARHTEVQTVNGPAVRVAFDVTYQALLTS